MTFCASVWVSVVVDAQAAQHTIAHHASDVSFLRLSGTFASCLRLWQRTAVMAQAAQQALIPGGLF